MDNLGLREDADREAILDNLRAADLPLDLHNFPPIISRIRRFVGNRRFALDVPAAFEVVADIGLEESLSLNYSISAAQEAVGALRRNKAMNVESFRQDDIAVVGVVYDGRLDIDAVLSASVDLLGPTVSTSRDCCSASGSHLWLPKTPKAAKSLDFRESPPRCGRHA